MYQAILEFWFAELEPKMWWVKSPELDASIAERFGKIHQAASKGELFDWRSTAKGCLAEVIVLDQFSRNIYRDQPQAFASDSMALALAQNAIEKCFDQELTMIERKFLYLPFMHSESVLIHEEAMKLYTELGDEKSLAFEVQHKVIIEQFGRYPHRNNILGRTSTMAELTFLEQPHSSF